MPQDQHVLAAAGDKLHDILERAMLALRNDDPSQLEQILGHEGLPALRAWDLARKREGPGDLAGGREVPSQYDFSPPKLTESS